MSMKSMENGKWKMENGTECTGEFSFTTSHLSPKKVPGNLYVQHGFKLYTNWVALG